MEEKRNRLTTKRIICSLSAIAVLCIVVTLTINQQTLKDIPLATTESVVVSTEPTETALPPETMSEEERNQFIRDSIDKTVSSWLAGEVSFEEATTTLNDIQKTCNSELVDYAEDQLAYITVENNGNILIDLAQVSLDEKNYTQVFKNLNDIDQTYSKYDVTLDLYQACEEQVLCAVEKPTTKEEFESYIHLLETCTQFYEAVSFADRKEQLVDELVVFLDVTETIDAATVQFDSENIEESFILLALGLEKHPDNERLASTLIDYRDHYIITITKQAVELCQQEEYKQALTIVEAAIIEYDCVEFQMLREAIKEEKSFLYRLKNDVVESFTSISNGWKKEEFDVKQAANNAGAYVVKSGKKLALGDYTDEDITLLSFSGNIAASVLGVDALFDLRDLSYDITHWGEEYFAVWLAADVVAILPVIGVVKYLSHFKTVAKGAEATTELVDSVADIGKNTDNAADLVDTISDVTKIGDDIVDAIDHATDANKVGLLDAVKDTITRIFSGYTPIHTINYKMAGKIHDETGVKFVLSKIELSDGRKLKGVFPKFDSYADIQLPENLYKASFNDQKKECLKQLHEKVKYPWSNLRKNFTEEQLADIANGILPEGFTWHHNEQEGLMQLVDTLIHDQTGHTGGMSIWGGGHK